MRRKSTPEVTAIQRVLDHCEKQSLNTTNKYGQFVCIATKRNAMLRIRKKHRNDHVFLNAYRKQSEKYVALRNELNKEAIYYNVLNNKPL